MHTKHDLLHQLKKMGIATKMYEHEPLFTVEQADKWEASIPGGHIKNLFLKDDRGKFWLLVADAHAKIELKKVAQLIKAPKLRFADANLLMEYLGVLPGSVTPFALINDTHHAVQVILDSDLLTYDVINAHPLQNDATISINQNDFKKFLEYTGHNPIVINFNIYELEKYA